MVLKRMFLVSSMFLNIDLVLRLDVVQKKLRLKDITFKAVRERERNRNDR
jgi:hypothetical protein